MSLFLRIVVLALVVIMAATIFFLARRRCSRTVRLPLDFALGLYFLTYAIGSTLLFLFQTDYLYYIFGIGQFLPSRTSYNLVLVVAVLPFIVVPLATWFFERLLGPVKPRTGPPFEVSNLALWVGTMGTLLISLVILLPVLGTLLVNGRTSLVSTLTLDAFYEQRRVAFEGTAWLQGGIIYTTLPSIAVILLLWPAQNRAMLRIVGSMVGILAVNLNLGLFQIGPTLTFMLSFVFCLLAVSGGRIDYRKVAVPSLLGLAMLAAYSVMKTAGYQVDAVQAYLLRMPSALPYLIQYAGEQPGTVASGDFTLSFELARYMYPDLVQYVGWIATPQPAFVDTYFTFNPLAGVMALVIIGFMIVVVGRSFAVSWQASSPRSPHTIFTAVIAAPVLYYVFQVDFFSLFSSAYSALFALPPILATLIVNFLVSPPTRTARRPVARSHR